MGGISDVPIIAAPPDRGDSAGWHLKLPAGRTPDSCAKWLPDSKRSLSARSTAPDLGQRLVYLRTLLRSTLSFLAGDRFFAGYR
jgi:hypothetical protein